MSNSLSVILPVYNVQAYLPACLESLMAQTLQPDEIIAVDDGSTDACSQILVDYALRMPNLRIIRQANGGLSAARNVGLDAASGEYVAFVDSDDFLSLNIFEESLRRVRDDKLDMLLFNAMYHFEGRESDRLIYTNVSESSVLTGADWLYERLHAGRLLHMVWLHLYRRDFIEANRFRFVPGLIHEDVIWTTGVLLAAKRVRYIPTPFYHYRIPIRKFSVEDKIRRLGKIIDSSLFNAQTLAELAEGIENTNLRKLLQRQMVDGAFSVFHKINQLPKQLRAKRLKELHSNGFFHLLWGNAQGFTQRRRIIHRWLRSLVAA
ncbi:glycosyltransferase [Thiothrix sp.]|jgi:glycosyltransferase involved in cell wall biosynthesis|uniref:glycosyltransferase n=1 Tax=Thiothrix sp. TaxID=1032 RepID=UPI00257F1193|nr:glycosyltransferase [Thiothrix sp.]